MEWQKMPMFRFGSLRRRWILLCIFVVLALFCLSTLLKKEHGFESDEYVVKGTILHRVPFEWQQQVPDLPEDTNSSRPLICRNSQQGKHLLVDERGYVCKRKHIDQGGCCNTKQSSTSKHTCDTCSLGGCCAIYEHCVSCCLHPDKKPLMKKVLQERREAADKLFASLENHFDLCLSKCRTSSMSVQHENSYRNSKTKHCYGQDPPEIPALMSI